MLNRLDEAHRIFRVQYPRGMNLMTPKFISLDMVGSLVYEVSGGRGIYDEPIYGVTVVEQLPDGTVIRRYDLSGLFYSPTEVRKHISNVIAPASRKEEVSP